MPRTVSKPLLMLISAAPVVTPPKLVSGTPEARYLPTYVAVRVLSGSWSGRPPATRRVPSGCGRPALVVVPPAIGAPRPPLNAGSRSPEAAEAIPGRARMAAEPARPASAIRRGRADRAG